MKTPAIYLAMLAAANALIPVFRTQRTFGVVTYRGAEEGDAAESEPVYVAEIPAPEPAPEPEPVFQVLSAPLPAIDDEDGFTQFEKDRIIDNVFDCHGFFPDLRSESQLPAAVAKMREQPKSAGELASIKAKYASMSEADAAFAMLVDLGLMEDYDKLGEYSDDFADDAM